MSALTSLLVRDEVVSVRKIEDALARQVLAGGELDSALLELDAAPENVLNAYRAASFRLAAVARDEVMSVNAATLSLISESQAQRLRIVPVTHDATTLVVAGAQPLDESSRAELSEAIGMRIESCICCEVRIEAALARHYAAELSPRMKRLADRVEQREPGHLPLVEPMQETPISGLAAELFEDDPDELEEQPVGATPIEPESLRPASPPHDVSVGRVLEVRPSDLPPVPESAPRHHTQVGVGHSSVPPATTDGVKPQSLSAAAGGRAANDVVFSKPARKPKRGPAVPQGPLTRELASQLLSRADDRDAVVEVFFRYARQYFEATALCSVREDRLLGREVHNVPNLTDIHGLSLSVQRGSGLEEVLRTLQPRVDDMSRKAEDQPLVEALRRMACQPSALLPVCIKRRVVAIIYGDRGGDYFQRSDLAQLVELLPEVSSAFERIIRTRKVLGLSARAQTLASARAELGHAQTQLDVTPPDVRAESQGQAKAESLLRNARQALGVPRTAPPPPAAAPRVAAAAPAPAQPVAAPRMAGAATAQASAALPAVSAQASAVARAAQPVVAGVAPMPKAAPGSSTQYSAVSEGARATTARGGFEGAVLAAASALEARPARRPEYAAQPENAANDQIDAPAELAPSAAVSNAHSPRAFDRRASAQDADEAISGALGALEQLERLPTSRLPAVEVETPVEAPRRPAYLSKPPPGAGSYSSLREGDGEDSEIAPESDTKRLRQQRLSRPSNRPRRSVPPEPVSPTAETQSTLPRFESPQAEPMPAVRPSKPPPGAGLYKSQTVPTEVVALSPPVPVGARRASNPASGPTPRGAPSAPVAPPPKRAASIPPASSVRRASKRPGAPADERRETPLATPAAEFAPQPKNTRSAQMPREASVIVDTLGQTRALIDDLCKCGPDDEGPIVQSLLRVGSEALDVLIERFPGPLWFDRRRPYARLPFGRDTGPIARALSAFGAAALARIHPLLRANNPDVRYYATLFVSDQVHPELLAPIAERLFDEDPQIRLMVRDTLPAYRQLPSFAQVLTSLRARMLDAQVALPARLAAIDALTHLRDGASVLPLVELLANPDRQLSVPAHRALVAITCQDFAGSMKKWRVWYEENQHRHRVQWLIESLMHSEQNLRSAAGIELQKVTQVYYGYVASAPKRDRERAQRRYQDWWENEGHKRF